MPRKQSDQSPKHSGRQTGLSGCIGPSRNAQQARAEGTLQPDLAYTGQQATPGPEGWVESGATVRSKQKSKEQFPQG